jgi:hypothetical protein
MCVHTANLAAGTHTIQMAYKTDDVASKLIIGGGCTALYVFQRGG